MYNHHNFQILVMVSLVLMDPNVPRSKVVFQVVTVQGNVKGSEVSRYAVMMAGLMQMFVS